MFTSKSRAIVGLIMLMVLASCGSDNETGNSGNNSAANGVPSDSRGCNKNRRAPNSPGNWEAFKQHIYNCNFDYLDPNIANQNFNNSNNYWGGYFGPQIFEYYYNRLTCDNWSCYTSGTLRVTAQINPNNGNISNISDQRRNVTSVNQAHSFLKNLVVGSVRNVQRSNYSPLAYQFDKGGKRYVIDLQWPMIANPVSEQIIPNNDNNSRGEGYAISHESSF